MKTNRTKRKKPPTRKQTGTWAPPSCCLGCGNKAGYEKKKITCELDVRGETFAVEAERWVCNSCNESFAGPGQVDASLRLATMAYQARHGLLTGFEIKERRQIQSWTQQDLADEAGVGVASVKRWETGTGVQTPANNESLEAAFTEALITQKWNKLTIIEWRTISLCGAVEALLNRHTSSLSNVRWSAKRSYKHTAKSQENVDPADWWKHGEAYSNPFLGITDNVSETQIVYCHE